ncbi:hypothetical protein [Natronolimnobius sp. AArcel1]|nr:hypothetical protein [Natronolimnobius sp. AArcel1]
MRDLGIYLLGLLIGALGAEIHLGAGVFLGVFVFVVVFVDFET